jgi:AcrR family transcriptional regulator
MPNTERKRGRGRRSLREARFDEILAAAGHLFYQHGFDGTTMQEIAESVDLLPGSLYYYISTKEDLLYEIALRVSKESLEFLYEPPELAASDAPLRLAAFLERWMQRVREARPREAYAAVERHRRLLSPERRTEVEQADRKVRAYLEEVVTQGVAQGAFTAVPTKVVINNILQISWFTALWFDPKGVTSFEEITAWYQNFILRGLGATESDLDEIGSTRWRRAPG